MSGADTVSEEATVLLRHLLLASPDHRELGKSLQATVINLHRNIRLAIDDAWRDRKVVWAGVMESGGSGLGGNVDKAREAVKPVVAEWKGLGVLS